MRSDTKISSDAESGYGTIVDTEQTVAKLRDRLLNPRLPIWRMGQSRFYSNCIYIHLEENRRILDDYTVIYPGSLAILAIETRPGTGTEALDCGLDINGCKCRP
jgi:hypothetical protein